VPQNCTVASGRRGSERTTGDPHGADVRIGLAAAAAVGGIFSTCGARRTSHTPQREQPMRLCGQRRQGWRSRKHEGERWRSHHTVHTGRYEGGNNPSGKLCCLRSRRSGSGVGVVIGKTEASLEEGRRSGGHTSTASCTPCVHSCTSTAVVSASETKLDAASASTSSSFSHSRCPPHTECRPYLSYLVRLSEWAADSESNGRPEEKLAVLYVS
jgi:hypothetical protein